jgi:hypothetical protein
VIVNGGESADACPGSRLFILLAGWSAITLEDKPYVKLLSLIQEVALKAPNLLPC